MKSNKVIPTFYFEKKLKRFLQKFPSLKDELPELETLLLLNPFSGIALGSNIFKIRVASKSKGRVKVAAFV